MKKIFFGLSIFVFSCTNSENPSQVQNDTVTTDSVKIDHTAINVDTTKVLDKPTAPTNINSSTARVYSNQRFRDVRVKKTGVNKYLITGKAQVFEASFSWVVEDGHEELKEGHQMTDAGAPAWGNFSFTVDVKKKRPNSTLHLILYEASAKDGSRQFLLPVLLR